MSEGFGGFSNIGFRLMQWREPRFFPECKFPDLHFHFGRATFMFRSQVNRNNCRKKVFQLDLPKFCKSCFWVFQQILFPRLLSESEARGVSPEVAKIMLQVFLLLRVVQVSSCLRRWMSGKIWVELGKDFILLRFNCHMLHETRLDFKFIPNTTYS